MAYLISYFLCPVNIVCCGSRQNIGKLIAEKRSHVKSLDDIDILLDASNSKIMDLMLESNNCLKSKYNHVRIVIIECPYK
jgi:hypothetical protein